MEQQPRAKNGKILISSFFKKMDYQANESTSEHIYDNGTSF